MVAWRTPCWKSYWCNVVVSYDIPACWWGKDWWNTCLVYALVSILFLSLFWKHYWLTSNLGGSPQKFGQKIIAHHYDPLPRVRLSDYLDLPLPCCKQNAWTPSRGYFVSPYCYHLMLGYLCRYVMDELGSAMRHSDNANFRIAPFLFMPEGKLDTAIRHWPLICISYNLLTL